MFLFNEVGGLWPISRMCWYFEKEFLINIAFTWSRMLNFIILIWAESSRVLFLSN